MTIFSGSWEDVDIKFSNGTVAVACDTYWGNDILLLDFETGVDGSTIITDRSPALHGNASVFGNAQVDTAQFKFGTRSGLFDGTGDYLSFPVSATWPLGNSWTIECFVRFNATTSDQCLLSQFIGALTGECWMVRTQPTASLEFFTYDGVSFIADIVSATSIYTTGVWYHLAVDSNGTKIRMYLDGVMIGSSTPAYTHTGQAVIPLTIGSDGLGSRPLNGWLDEVRITAGVARYNSDAGFTVPTAAFPQVPCSCAESTAFLARTSGLDLAHTNAYTSLICGLVTDGVWSKLDVLHIYATQDTTTAQLNLVSASYPATLHGSPTFTADRGYTGVSASATVYIDTGFNPSTAGGVYVLNSAHLSYWNLTNITEATNIGAIIGAASTLITGAYSSGDFFTRINCAAAGGNVVNANKTGHFVGSRTASNVTGGYRNGSSLLSSNNVSTSIPNGNIYTIGSNTSGSPIGVGQQYAMTSIGSALSSTDVTNFYNRLRTYMTAVGVP